MYNGKKVMINLKSFSIICFALYMLTASLYVAIFNSAFIQMLILVFVLSILLINEINKDKPFILLHTDILFILSIFASLFSLRRSTLNTGEIAGPVIFSLGIIISFFIRGDIRNYISLFYLLLWSGIFYSLSVILSYLYPDIYCAIFFPLLRSNITEKIVRLMQRGYYTGFTSDVSYTAGYIVNGLGIICCSWMIGHIPKRKLNVFLLSIMLLGLLLTQKRAHLLFFILSLIFVYIQYSRSNYERIIKVLKVLLISVLGIAILILIIQQTSIGRRVFARIIRTIQIFISGGDITSNRIPLYKHALNLFSKNPILGIGWGNYKKTVVGNVTVNTEMKAHNIYLQLLSETGLLGSILILLPFFITFFYTIRATHIVSMGRDIFSHKWIFTVLYSLYIQTFFLLYGLTGNPLYDPSFLIMYFIAIGLVYSFRSSGNTKSTY
jgi:O-antigen ligase